VVFDGLCRSNATERSGIARNINVAETKPRNKKKSMGEVSF
jgi:hypothetical protein